MGEEDRNRGGVSSGAGRQLKEAQELARGTTRPTAPPPTPSTHLEHHTVARGIKITPTQAREHRELIELISKRWGKVDYSMVTRALWQVLKDAEYGIKNAAESHIRDAPRHMEVEARRRYEQDLVAFLGEKINLT